MIFTYSDYIRSIDDELSRNPKKVWISSYNFNCGISDRGTVYSRSPAHTIINSLDALARVNKPRQTRVLIGVPVNNPFDLQRKLVNSAEYFSNITWRFKPEQHLKCWIFFHRDGTKRALIGGRNLGDSEWADISVWIRGSDVTQLARFYDDLWLNAIPVRVAKPVL